MPEHEPEHPPEHELLQSPEQNQVMYEHDPLWWVEPEHDEVHAPVQAVWQFPVHPDLHRSKLFRSLTACDMHSICSSLICMPEVICPMKDE